MGNSLSGSRTDSGQGSLPGGAWYIWCDASHHGNTQNAWGAVVVDPQGNTAEHSGLLPACKSSLIAELLAFFTSLERVPDRAEVIATSDCLSVVHAIQNALKRGMSSEVMTSEDIPIPGFLKTAPEHMETLRHHATRLGNIRVEWVKGHSGHPENSRADWLARTVFSGHIPYVPPPSRTPSDRSIYPGIENHNLSCWTVYVGRRLDQFLSSRSERGTRGGSRSD